MVRRATALPKSAKYEAESLVDSFRRRVRLLEMDLANLESEGNATLRLQSETHRSCSVRRSELRHAAAMARRDLNDAEAAFRISAELDRALAGVDADLRAAEQDIAERRDRIRKQREHARTMLSAMRGQLQRLERASESSYGLAPWDTAAREAQRVLNGEADGRGSTDGEGDLLRMAEVVALFGTQLRISRSQFYAKYRPLLRPRILSPRRLILWADGGASLVGCDSTMRFLRSEVEALIAYLQERAF